MYYMYIHTHTHTYIYIYIYIYMYTYLQFLILAITIEEQLKTYPEIRKFDYFTELIKIILVIVHYTTIC